MDEEKFERAVEALDEQGRRQGSGRLVLERELTETPPMTPVMGRDFDERLVL